MLDATVRLVEDAPARALAVLGYPTMADAADAVPTLLEHDLVACEGLDQRIAGMVAAHPELPAGGGWLFAEVTGDDGGGGRVEGEGRGRLRAWRTGSSPTPSSSSRCGGSARTAPVWRRGP